MGCLRYVFCFLFSHHQAILQMPDGVLKSTQLNPDSVTLGEYQIPQAQGPTLHRQDWWTHRPLETELNHQFPSILEVRGGD